MPSRGFERSNEPRSSFLEGKNYLLVIGINDYQHFQSLNNAVRDAETIRDLLLERFQFQPEHTTSLFNTEATRENILDKLITFRDTIQSGDNFMLYFAGHGAMNPRGSQGYWISTEAKRKESHYLPNSHILDILKDMAAHHIYLMVDSCFSGSLILRSTGPGSKLLESYPSRRVLTSGRKQAVADGPIGGHSPFADCIIEYLRKHTAQPISALDLEYHVQRNTPRTAVQHPEAAFIYGLGDQSGQFVFRPKRNEARDWQQTQKERSDALRNVVQESRLWASAQQSHSISGYQQYVKEYPQGSYTREAQKLLQKLEAG